MNHAISAVQAEDAATQLPKPKHACNLYLLAASQVIETLAVNQPSDGPLQALYFCGDGSLVAVLADGPPPSPTAVYVSALRAPICPVLLGARIKQALFPRLVLANEDND